MSLQVFLGLDQVQANSAKKNSMLGMQTSLTTHRFKLFSVVFTADSVRYNLCSLRVNGGFVKKISQLMLIGMLVTGLVFLGNGCGAGFETNSALQNSSISDLPPRDTVPEYGFDGVAELPRVYVDTRIVQRPSTSRTIAVAANGDFQAAIDAAQPGDVITLAAGATYIGNFILRRKEGNG